MKNIYIMLTMTGTKFSRFLKFMMKKEFSHSSIVLDEDLVDAYSFGRRSMLMPIIAGFIKEDINSGVYKKYEPDCEILKIEVTDEQYSNVKKEIAGFVKKYDKYHYNLLGLPLMWFDIPYERENNLVCSQFVAQILERSGIYTFEKGWVLVRPMDFKEIGGIETIYKGSLREYNSGVKVEFIENDESVESAY